MNNKFVISLIISLVPINIFSASSIESSVQANLQKSIMFNRLKHALLEKDLELVYQIEKEDPAIWSYVDPKTGQMMIHEVFRHSYPAKSIRHVIHSTPSELMKAKDGLGNRPLHYFVQKADEYSADEFKDIFNLLSRHSVSLLSKNNKGVTPLHLAASINNPDFFKHICTLLPDGYKDKGYLDWKDSDGKTPLMYAVDYRKKANLCTLLQRGALFDKEFVQYLRDSYRKNVEEDILRKNIIDSKKQDELRQFYADRANKVGMILAAHAQKFEPDFSTIVTNMLESGVDINHQDAKGNTLLHYAMAYYSDKDGILSFRNRQNNHAMVSTLLALGADPELQNKYGNKPDFFDLYSDELEYYKNLRNGLKMDEKRDTLVGQLMLKAYEDWFYHDKSDLLKSMICDDEINEIPQNAQQKARELFQPEFIRQICS